MTNRKQPTNGWTGTPVDCENCGIESVPLEWEAGMDPNLPQGTYCPECGHKIAEPFVAGAPEVK